MEEKYALILPNGYELKQVNGQRIYSYPGATSNKKGCEVFVGRIPRNMFEDELAKIFEILGPIYRIRLMMEFNGLNRGFAFVSYFQKETANVAVKYFHNYEVRGNCRIAVHKSLDNCRLFVSGIPQEKKKKEIFEAFREVVEGVVEIIIYPLYGNKNLNRGFAFLEFGDHRTAAMAKRKLSPGSLYLWGNQIFVEWAEPLPDVDPIIMSRVKKLYIRNLDLEMTDLGMKQLILNVARPDTVLKVYKTFDYAFVHFSSREAAEDALKKLQKFYLNGELLDVDWARPRIYSKKYRLEHTPNHFCLSLPPRSRNKIKILKNKYYQNRNFSPVKNNNEVVVLANPFINGIQTNFIWRC